MNDNVSMSDLSEQDVRDRLITPALDKAGWSASKRRAEYSYRKDYQFTDGRIDVREGKVARQKGKRVDYLLFKDKSHAIAVVEAKDANHEVGDGLQQAKDYAKDLDLKFAYASNGKGFIEFDFFTGLTREFGMNDFPRLEELENRYRQEGNVGDNVAKALDTPFYYDPNDGKEPRYYQRIAADRAVKAAARGQKRMLLVMATGTGKTFTAFQIVHRLRKAGIVKKVLYLVDRNILADQTLAQDFKSLRNVSTKIERHNLDPAYEVYFALYQQLVNPDEEYYKDFAPDFFDLVIVDECHRSSVDENKSYHKILRYFEPAIQIGMTATPKETADKSNISYFGEPIYTYSLKNGIEDGYLAPYEVIKVDIDKDVEGYRPEEGKTDVEGNLIEDRIYKRNDFDRNIVLNNRTRMVARRITEYLKETNRYSRTIVFCVDQEHAGRMRDELANANADMMRENSDYVIRITANDKPGLDRLDDFVDKNTIYPVIATTSQLLSTGVDTKTVKLIVLDKTINSMTEFKQIIGRGTRLVVGDKVPKNKQKAYFTIMDFRHATDKFADPDFDGEPVQAVDWQEGEPADKVVREMKVAPLQQKKEMLAGEAEPDKERKVRVDGVDVKIVDENVEYYNPISGKLINEKMDDFVRRYLRRLYPSKEDFVKAWQDTPIKKDILDKLFSGGNMLDGLIDKYGGNYDIFDILLKVGYDMPLIDKEVRVNKVKLSPEYTQMDNDRRLVVDELLSSYTADGVTELEDIDLLTTKKFEDSFGGAVKIVELFGGINGYWSVIATIKGLLYS